MPAVSRPLAISTEPFRENSRSEIAVQWQLGPQGEKLSALRVESRLQERAARADISQVLKLLKRTGKSKLPIKGDELAK